jgi:glucose-1-phosphate thymidylyltransferase
VIPPPPALAGCGRRRHDGSHFGLDLSWATQAEPRGIAQAFTIGAEFIGGERVALALGDNVFYGAGLPEILRSASARDHGATVFGYRVRDPERYGVVELDRDGKPVRLVEKPKQPRSPYAVVGLYFYDNRVVDIASNLVPSARGELEITDVNRAYLEAGDLHVEILGRGIAWLDTGTHHSLLLAANYIQAIEERQGLMVACLEEVAYNMGFLDRDGVRRAADRMAGTEYGQYLTHLLDEERRG